MLVSSLITAAVTYGFGLFHVAAATDGGFRENCNTLSAQLVGSDVGMYCQNKNTAMYGYNWTWYVARPGYLPLPCITVAGGDGGWKQKNCNTDIGLDRIDLNKCIGNRAGRLSIAK